MLDPLALVRELVAIPSPPGQEAAVRDAVAAHLDKLGCVHETDARGNLLIAAPGVSVIPERPRIVVMAHLDEIALLVARVETDGTLAVASLGGAYPWKWGEGPVSILAEKETLTGILSFGSIHSAAKSNPAVRAREEPLTWDMARVFTGLTCESLAASGVRPGMRITLHPSQRTLTELGVYVSAPFLDDRADLAALLLVLERLAREDNPRRDLLFAATAAEEVGGHGALYLLRQFPAEIGIALEIGPRVPEAPFTLDAQPTVWVNDSYSAMMPADIALVASAAESIGLAPHFQALARGGSDASCAASHGLIARPITLAFAAENSHGHEIMHRDAVANLASLTCAVLEQVTRTANAPADVL